MARWGKALRSPFWNQKWTLYSMNSTYKILVYVSNYTQFRRVITSNISLSNIFEMKFGPSVNIIYSPKEIQKSVNMSTQTFGVKSIFRYGGRFFPISFIGCFRCCKMCFFSSVLMNRWCSGSSLTKKNQKMHQITPHDPPI